MTSAPASLPNQLANYRDKITVTFERRPDGGLRVYSDELPGLALSYADHAAVLADLRPAIEGLLLSRLTAAEAQRDAALARAERAEKALEPFAEAADDLEALAAQEGFKAGEYKVVVALAALLDARAALAHPAPAEEI